MDLSTRDVNEDTKYAFLLGSALRNEDPEQTLAVYDNLIPEDISAYRLEEIKQEARHIFELSEDEFSTLVLKARSYSLAFGRSSMNQTSGRSPVPPPDARNDDRVSSSAKGDGLGNNHIVHTQVDPALCSSLASSLLHKTQPNLSDSLSVKIDLDLAGASAEEEEEDSRVPDPSIKASGSLKSSAGCWDSTYGDSEDDRPGSFDYMPSQSDHVRIRHSYNPPYDEEVKVDSSTGDSSVESPRSETSVTHDEYNVADDGTEMFTLSYKETPQPFVREHKTVYPHWHYTRSSGKHSDDESMEDEEEERGRLRGTSYSAVSSFSRQVDESISYNLKPLDGPAGGHAGRQFTLTPYSPYVEQYKSDGSKEKKDKKKRKSRDDSDKPEVSGLVDINGNPSLPDQTNYTQMRQLPRGKSENSASVSLASSNSASNTQTYNSTNSETYNLDRKKERKRMKLEKQKWTPAEAYEDHKDFQDIKDILDFVEGPNSSSRAEGKSAKKKQERSKKKDQHLTQEDAAGGEDGPNSSEATDVTATVGSGAEAMGNSSAKSHVENNIISKIDSAEDSLDKSSEFHDCLNTLPAELVILDRGKLHQSEKSEKVVKTISLNLAETEKSSLFITRDSKSDILTDNNKSASKKSTKTKSKKEKREVVQENGPLSPKASMAKPKESFETKELLLVKSGSANADISFQSSNETEMLPEVKREDSFTEVKKRKKRIGGKDSNSAPSNHSSNLHYHSHNESGHLHRNNPRPIAGTPPPPSTAGAITVTYSSSSLPVIDHAQSSRDLSPSAFPVLSGHGPLVLHKEARRNSCGDITTDSIDNKTYDSDRESAKSLPDAHGARVCGDMSPIYPVSYARMAAAPRRNDSTNSPSSESGVASGSQNSSVNSSITHTPGSSIDVMSPKSSSNTAVMPERKATVWKGSPRERRHSIGSSPEDKIEGDKSSVTQRNRQCGSQEVLSRDCIAPGSAASQNIGTSSTVAAKVVHTSEISNNLQYIDLQETLHPHDTSVSSSQSATKSPVQQLAKVTSEYASANSISSSQGGPVTTPSKQSAATIPGKEKPGDVTAAQSVTPDPSKAKTDISAQVTTGTSVAGDSSAKTVSVPSKNKNVSVANSARKNSGSTNNTKSVIFLDKRFGASLPQNLGITFGFDSSFESTSEPTSQSTGQQQSHSQLTSDAPPSSSPQTSSASSSVQPSCPQPLPCSTAHPHIPTPAQAAASSSKPPATTASSLQASDNSSLVPKDPHIQGPRNGLILPSSPAGNCAILSEQVTISSISSSKDDSNINLIPSSRTNPPLKSEALVSNHNINSLVASGPVILPALANLSSAVQANGPLAQLSNKSAQHIVTLNVNVTITRAHSTGVTYSPNYPPPTLPQAVLGTSTRENSITTNTTTSALPSAQEKRESNPVNRSVASSTESTLSTSASSSAMPAKVGEPTEGLEIPEAVMAELDTHPVEEPASQQQRQQCSSDVPHEVLLSAVHVVYGEKIKPSTGCGKLLFIPHELSQKSKGNAAEIGNFLRRRWFEEVTQKKDPGAFSVLTDI